MAIKIYDLVVQSKKASCYAYLPDEVLASPYRRGLYRFIYNDASINWPEWINSFYFYAQEGLTEKELSELDYLKVLGPYALFSERFINKFSDELKNEATFHPVDVISQRGGGVTYKFFLAKFLLQGDFLCVESPERASVAVSLDIEHFLFARETNPDYAYCYFASEHMLEKCRNAGMKISFKEAKYR